jgi:hypothetical protein
MAATMELCTPTRASVTVSAVSDAWMRASLR